MQPRSDFEAHQRDEEAFAADDARRDRTRAEKESLALDIREPNHEERLAEARQYWNSDEGGD